MKRRHCCTKTPSANRHNETLNKAANGFHPNRVGGAREVSLFVERDEIQQTESPKQLTTGAITICTAHMQFADGKCLLEQ